MALVDVAVKSAGAVDPRAAVEAIPRSYNFAADILERNLAAGRGQKPAFIDPRGSWTYGELAERVDRFGNVLRALGIRCEERVVRLGARAVRVVRRVESVCCAFTLDTPPNVRAIARPIAQLLENPIRIFSPPTVPPSAFKPPRATLRAEHQYRSVVFSRHGGGGAHPLRAPSDDHRRGTPDCGILRAAARLKHWQPNPAARRGWAISI